jgi:hypothetical protein
MAGTNITSLDCVLELSVQLNALRMSQFVKTLTFHRANLWNEADDRNGVVSRVSSKVDM